MLPGVLGSSLGNLALFAPLSHVVRTYAASSGIKSQRVKPKAGSPAEPKSAKGSKAASATKDDDKKSTKVKAKTSKPAPRSTSAWSFYVKEMAPKVRSEGVSYLEVLKEVSARWKTLSDAEKAPFQQLHLQSKEQADKAKEEIKANRAPPTGYARFVKNTLPSIQAQMPGLTASERLVEVAKKWKAMSTAEKQEILREGKAEVAKWKEAKGLPKV